MSISLLEDLQAGEYETAVFLTYTIHLRFFELMILPRLRRMGVSRVGVLVDQRGYQESLTDPLTQEFCGQEYILAPIRLPRGGIQHAKLLWLQKQEAITAYVGSHNLTMAGYNDQVEITAKLSSRDQEHTKALRELHNVVSAIVPPAFEYVWSHTKAPPETRTASTIHVLTSYSRPLVEQIIDYVPAADTLRVITPFLDAHALQTLAHLVHAQTVVLDLPKDGADIPLLAAMEALPDLQPRFLADRHNRRLHAKAYHFSGANESWLAIGSANCTQAALMKSTTEGGNLEFLLFLKDMDLSDDLNFTEIADPVTFPHTGRNWDSSPLPLSLISIEKASYRGGRLSVEWNLPEKGVVSDMGLYADGKRIPHDGESAASLFLELPPHIITLKATINGSCTETSAWIINYDALDQKVSRAKLHQWVEHIASDDPQVHADSIALWLEQVMQEILQSYNDTETIPYPPGATRQQRDVRPEQSLYEVFTYSMDPQELRKSATALLENYSNTDPLVLLKVLLTRFAAELPTDISTSPDEDDDANFSDLQRRLMKRTSAAHNIVRHLIRQLDQLIKTQIPETNLEQTFLILRRLFCAITYICLKAMGDARLKDAEDLTQRYIFLLGWLTTQLSERHASQRIMHQPQFKGSLLLSLGATAKVAERCKDSALYAQLQKYAKSLIKEEPGQIITAWRRLDPEDADKCLNLPGQGNVWHKVEPHILPLFDITPHHIKQLIEKRWGLLLELQAADLSRDPTPEYLYDRAKKNCPDTQIWAHYDIARRMNQLPVIIGTTDKVCSQCNERLATHKSQRLRNGEAVICDNCHRILLLKG